MAFSDSRFIAFSLIKILSSAKRGPAGVMKSLNGPCYSEEVWPFQSPPSVVCSVHHSLVLWESHNVHGVPLGRLLIPVETWDLIALGVCVCCFAIYRKFVLLPCYLV